MLSNKRADEIWTALNGERNEDSAPFLIALMRPIVHKAISKKCSGMEDRKASQSRCRQMRTAFTAFSSPLRSKLLRNEDCYEQK